MSKTMDFVIEGEKGFYMVAAISPEARDWVEANVSVPEYADPFWFPCEGGYVEHLTLGMIQDGFFVEVNGRLAYEKDGEILSAPLDRGRVSVV